MGSIIRLISRKFLETEAFTKDLDTPPVGEVGSVIYGIKEDFGYDLRDIRKIRDLSRFWYGFREIRFRSAAGGKFWDSDPFRNAFLTLKYFKCGANLHYFPFIYHICAPKFMMFLF